MKFGIFDHLDRGGRDAHRFYEERLSLIELYDREAFYCYHLAEHHATPIGLAPAPSVFLSAVAQRTKRLRFAPLVYLLPFYHPLRLVEEICMIDQMSGGRYEIGVGRGISPVEASFYGVDVDEAAGQYAEALEIVRAGLRDAELTFRGTYYAFDKVPLQIEPFQRPFPPFWYGVHSGESAQRAVRAGFHVVTNEGVEKSAPVAAAFHAERRATGYAGGEREMGVVRHLVVAESDEQAYALAKPAYAAWVDNFYFLHRRYGLTSAHAKARDLDAALAEGTAIVGSAETVAARLREQFAAVGFTYLLGQFAFGDLPAADAARSIGSFAREVIPAIRGLGASLQGP